MIIEKGWEYQKRFEKWWEKFQKKNNKHLVMLPRIVIMFLILHFFGHFIENQLDLYLWVIYSVSLGSFVLFFPFSKYV